MQISLNDCSKDPSIALRDDYKIREDFTVSAISIMLVNRVPLFHIESHVVGIFAIKPKKEGILEVKRGKKKANQVSHRYNHLPLLPSGPGGVQQELVVLICQYKAKPN